MMMNDLFMFFGLELFNSNSRGFFTPKLQQSFFDLLDWSHLSLNIFLELVGEYSTYDLP